MTELLAEVAAQGIRPGYVRKLLAAFELVKKDEPSIT